MQHAELTKIDIKKGFSLRSPFFSCSRAFEMDKNISMGDLNKLYNERKELLHSICMRVCAKQYRRQLSHSPLTLDRAYSLSPALTLSFDIFSLKL